MNFNRGKMAAVAVLAATLLVVGGVTGYGLHRAGTVGQPFVDDGRLKVMASFYPMYDFARKVGGDKIQVKDMVPAGTEPHDWEPAATDIRNLEDADVFVYNGADLEHWAEDVLDTLENQDLVVSEASDGVSFWMEVRIMLMAIMEKIPMSGWIPCGRNRRWRILRMLL